MTLEIKIPNIAEAIVEVVVAKWLKRDGETVKRDEPICEIETDKASQELYAEADGTLQTIAKEGETVPVGATIAKINIQKEPTPQIMETKSEIREIKLTNMGAESVTEAVVGAWLKQDGDFIKLDEPICELETDKAAQELPAEVAGILRIVAEAGKTLQVGELLCRIEVGTSAPAGKVETLPTPTPEVKTETKTDSTPSYAQGHPSPAASKILAEKGVEAKDVTGSGKDGRITKEDAQNVQKATPHTETKTEAKVEISAPAIIIGGREQRRVRMTQMRKTISRRLVAVKNETAMLTTFNEVNMKPIMEMRKKYKEEFQTAHGVGLGFMSFFTRASALALQKFPEVNAMIDGGTSEIVYNDFVDISVAVSAPKGLVVPVLRNVEAMGFADIEKGIINLATKAKNNALSIEDMQGGTFTITNGGIFGSMMSTPIINAPQSAILGMHNIVERPMAVNGQVVILPMMYVALSYDHRIIDGREAVGFLVTIKKYLEEPERMLFGI